MWSTTEPSRYRPVDASRCSKSEAPARRRRRISEGDGFTLVEVLICTLILTTGMLAIAGLLGVTTQMHFGAREAARGTRLAEEKIDELMKLNFATAPSIAVGGDLSTNVTNYFEQLDGVTIRWAVAAGPVTDTRVLTVRVENRGAQQYGRQVELSTIIRQW